MTETSVGVAFGTTIRGSAGYVGRVSTLVTLGIAAALVAGCTALSGSGTGSDALVDAIERAAAPAASLTPEAVVAGRPASVGSFCDALVPFFQRSGSYDQSEGLHNQAEALVKQAEDHPDAGIDAPARAVRLSCAARNGFGPDEYGPDDG